MADTGVKYPATVSTVQETGDDNDWTSPSSVGADDATYARITAATFDAGDVSYLLKATNLSMAVPSGATINGILVEIERYYANGLVEDVDVVLTKDGSNRVGNDKSTGADFTTSAAIVSFGGATDLWGTTWSVAEVNASTFGVLYKMGAVNNDADGYVDFIRVTIYYTAGGYSWTVEALTEGHKVYSEAWTGATIDTRRDITNEADQTQIIADMKVAYPTSTVYYKHSHYHDNGSNEPCVLEVV